MRKLQLLESVKNKAKESRVFHIVALCVGLVVYIFFIAALVDGCSSKISDFPG